MNDLLLDNNHDLDLTAQGLQIVQGADRVRQNILIKLRLWREEWFLDTEFGTPYLENILGKRISLAGSVAAIRAAILEVSDVDDITEFNYSFNRKTRVLDYNFTASTQFGLIRVVT